MLPRETFEAKMEGLSYQIQEIKAQQIQSKEALDGKLDQVLREVRRR